MSLSHAQTIDDLLSDSLIQTVMRADHVEPEALKSMLTATAHRLTAAPGGGGLQRSGLVFTRLPAERRLWPRALIAPPVARRAPRLTGGVCDQLCG
jgi:hypothetical protein